MPCPPCRSFRLAAAETHSTGSLLKRQKEPGKRWKGWAGGLADY